MKTHKGSLALRSALVALIAFAMLTPAHADVLYTFNVTPTNSAFQPFTFGFTDSTFAASGEHPSFSPFTLTDGTHTWTMNVDLAINGSHGGCFEFGGQALNLTNQIGAGCSFNTIIPPVISGAFELQIAGGLPAADGTYAVSGNGDFTFPIGSPPSDDVSSFNGTLTVSSSDPVPEPGNLILLGTGLLGVGPLVRARRKQAY